VALGQRDLTAFVRLFQREPWLLDDAFVEFQAKIIGRATLKDQGWALYAAKDEKMAQWLGAAERQREL
jgi:hypothetical protein